ncbi:MAG: tyrosine-type recombinase/integrase [Parasporobacterium sp.]|nr:tyrosine-type recombinase/integrase [Parasporobacterium sp.]
MAEKYKKTVEKNCMERIRAIKSSLPLFVHPYFDYLRVAPRTKLAYAYDLKRFFEYLAEANPEVSEPSEITPEYLNNLKMQDILEFLDYLKYDADNEERALARKLSFMRGFWKWLNAMELTTRDPTLLIKAEKIPRKTIVKMEAEETKYVLNAIETGEVFDLVKEADEQICSNLSASAKENYKPVIAENSGKRRKELNITGRDEAIIAVLLGTGLRVSELVGIDMEDLDFHDNSIKVVRKGGNENKVFFNDAVAEKIRTYLADRKIPKDGSNALFVSAHYKRISVRSVELLVKQFVDPLVENKHITTHKLRATYATDLYRKSRDIYLTSTALNHSSPATTAAHYADIGDERRREAADYIDFFDNNKE